MAPTQVEFSKKSDAELLAAVLLRTERAWEEFLRRYRGLIYRCIGKVTAKYAAVIDRDDVDEIFADVCLNLLRDDMHKLRAYRSDRGSKLGSWVGLIAINTAYDYLRGVARQPRLERLDNTPDVATPALSPFEMLCEQERWVRLNRFVCSFSPRDRRFLELYYTSGLEPEEIAEEMGISIKTVYSKKNKVLSRLCRMVQRGEASVEAAKTSRKRATQKPASRQQPLVAASVHAAVTLAARTLNPTHGPSSERARKPAEKRERANQAPAVLAEPLSAAA